MFKLFLFTTTVFSIIQICPAHYCNFEDCNADDDTDGLYDDYCIESRLFKPYLKIYKYRKGTLITSGGPKMYIMPETEQYEDIYVCLNGPAWLYFSKHTPLGVVFHKPEDRVWVHECQFFNGKKGPGSHLEVDRLMAIRLMGHPRDYRKPTIHLFTAPLYNNITDVYENVTSIMTFGKKACYIERGPKDNKITITIHPNPDFQHSYCKLAYQNINNTMYPDTHPPQMISLGHIINNVEFPITQPEDLFALLKNDVALKETGCEKNDIIPRFAHPDFIRQLIIRKEKKIEQMADYYKNKTSAIILAITADVDFNAAVYGQLTENITEVKANLQNYTTILSNATLPADLKRNATRDKKSDEEGKKLFELRQSAMSACAFMKNDSDNGFNKTHDAAWALLKKYFEFTENLHISELVNNGELMNQQHDLKEVFKNMELLKSNYMKDKSDMAVKTMLVNERINYQLQLDKVEAQIFELDKQLALAIALSKQRQDLFTNCQRALKRLKSPSLPPPFPHTSTIIAIQQKFGQPDIPYLNRTDNCKALPTVEEECRAVKPNKNRACHFLNAIMNRPEICIQNENDDVTEIPPEETTENNIGVTNTQILDLIKDIYEVACTLFPDRRFADRITRVFKCYLMKPVEHEGAGMIEVDEMDELMADPPLSEAKANPQLVTQILEALRVCKEKKWELKFRKDPNYFGHGKHKRYQFWNNRVFTDLHLHSEQADKEFAFNFAIDMHFKMFATVMGLCMPSHAQNNRNSLISAMFYATYTRIFYDPLKYAWTNPADNRIFNLLLGNFKNQNGELYADHCMEASFVHGRDVDYRPPRKLFVNSNSEANYFTSGNLSHKSHKYLSAFK